MLRRNLILVAATVAVGATALLAGIAPAHADWDGWRDHRDGYWREREWRHEYWRERPYVYAPPPPVYYAPPPAYYPPPRIYAPPPRYYAPPPVYFGFGVR